MPFIYTIPNIFLISHFVTYFTFVLHSLHKPMLLIFLYISDSDFYITHSASDIGNGVMRMPINVAFTFT